MGSNRLYERCNNAAKRFLLITKELRDAISETKWETKKFVFLENLLFIEKFGPTTIVFETTHDFTNQFDSPIDKAWYYLTELSYSHDDLKFLDDDDDSFVQFIAMLESALKELEPASESDRESDRESERESDCESDRESDRESDPDSRVLFMPF